MTRAPRVTGRGAIRALGRAGFARLARERLERGGHHAGLNLCTRRSRRELADRIRAALHSRGSAPLVDAVLHA